MFGTIGILTGGGDAPGLNAVIRAVVKTATCEHGMRVIGIEDGFENEKELGKIIEVIEQPHQILCTIEFNNKEAYIPLHQETIKKVDRKKKQVIVELPPGLLEIYL